MTRSLLFIGGFLALALTACAGSSELLTDEHVAQLRPGVSRAAEVRELIGAPYRVDALPRLEREVWSYRVYRDGIWPENLFVQFSRDGIVREVLLIDDSEG
jgi:outer membrane protein assembly factor BamE (lipoprotein component of BamABCDE complex)